MKGGLSCVTAIQPNTKYVMTKIFLSYLILQFLEGVVSTINSAVDTRLGISNFVALAIVSLFTQVTYTVPTAYAVSAVKVHNDSDKYNYMLLDVVRKTVYLSAATMVVFIPVCYITGVESDIISSGVLMLALTNLAIICQSPSYVNKRYLLANGYNKTLYKMNIVKSVMSELLYVVIYLTTHNIYIMLIGNIFIEVIYTVISIHVYGEFSLHSITKFSMKELNVVSVWKERLYVKLYRLVCGQLLVFVGTINYAINNVFKRVVSPIFDVSCNLGDAVYLSKEIIIREIKHIVLCTIALTVVYMTGYVLLMDIVFNNIVQQNKVIVFAVLLLYSTCDVIYNTLRGMLRVQNEFIILERISKVMLFVTPLVMIISIIVVPVYAYIATNLIEHAVCSIWYYKVYRKKRLETNELSNCS